MTSRHDVDEHERTAEAFVRCAREIRATGASCDSCGRGHLEGYGRFSDRKVFRCDIDQRTRLDGIDCPMCRIADAADAFGVPQPTDRPRDYLAALEADQD
jgi:hypothetical protein